MIGISAVDYLPGTECWRLLENAHLGRLASSVDGRLDLLPMNYLVSDRTLVFRCAAESRFGRLDRPDVAFEIDGEDSRWYWTVTVQGTAERLHGDDVLKRSGAMKLASWSPTDEFDFVRLVPEIITGRRIDRHEFRRSSGVG
jgi:nitroimidazol reductase NimA-like FMN-containing flavoprotein (pyridoxamine 5'-phosphate oxidase superfamily)